MLLPNAPSPLQEAGLPVGLLLIMQRRVAAATPAAAAALPEGKTPKKGKKQQQPAAAAAPAAAADEAEWLPDLMAALAEQVREAGRLCCMALHEGLMLRSS